jgi:hypothetical protein
VAAATEHVYRDVAHAVVASAMEGVNGTIFAYGQTASGKTHTMQGTRDEPGVIPLAVRDIFHYVETVPRLSTLQWLACLHSAHPQRGQCREREFLLRVSYMEIYNEAIRDLLAPANDNLKIHENAQARAATPVWLELGCWGADSRLAARDICRQPHRGNRDQRPRCDAADGRGRRCVSITSQPQQLWQSCTHRLLRCQCTAMWGAPWRTNGAAAPTPSFAW